MKEGEIERFQRERGNLEIELSPQEIAMFEHLRAMELVHNELGANLSLFKDSIMESRNDFVRRLCAKYHIESPNLVQYDPSHKRVISVFHPRSPLVRVKHKPAMFAKLAQDMMFKAIETLTSLAKGGEENEQKG